MGGFGTCFVGRQFKTSGQIGYDRPGNGMGFGHGVRQRAADGRFSGLQVHAVGVAGHCGGPVAKDGFDADIPCHYVEQLPHIPIVVDDVTDALVIPVIPAALLAPGLNVPGSM